MATTVCTPHVTVTASQLKDSMVETMTSKLIALAGHYKQYNHGLLSYFADDIRSIAFETLAKNRDRQEYLILELARQYHQQAITHGGLLHCDRYLNHHEAKTLHDCPGPILFEPRARRNGLASEGKPDGQQQARYFQIGSRHRNVHTGQAYEPLVYQRLRETTPCAVRSLQTLPLRLHLGGDQDLCCRYRKRLLQAYYDLVKRVDMRQHFGTRLLVYIYQNGENKSCTTSLARLEKSGLYSLYPEFGIQERHKLWTKQQHLSTYKELEAALLLARACFVGFDVLDIAIIFLSFKRRKFKQVRSGKELLAFIALHVISNESPPVRIQRHLQGFEGDIPEWRRKPQEVRQYLAALHILQPIPWAFNGVRQDIQIGSIAVEPDRGSIQALLKCFLVLT
ncbi:hypothetical protein BJX70DRAFT_408916 [Aspergillus crustosus]